MNKKLLLIILIGICTISAVSASSYDSDTFALDNSTNIETQPIDESPEVSESNTHHIDPSTNIQDAIDQADAGDTIVLKGTFELKKAINIDKTITITGEGDGATIKPNENNFNVIRFFNIGTTASNVVLSNVKLIGGNGKFGGSVLWEGNDGIITNCEFGHNMAGESSGGAILVKGNNCKITDCTFTSNIAKQGAGGAIAVEGNDCQITNCIFNENSANLYAGAILMGGSNGRITDCTFSGNFASQSGGAIAVKGEENTISKSKFNRNYLNSVKESFITGGAAIYSADSSNGMTVDNCTFTENDARGAYGGAIASCDKDIIKNSFFKDNTALFGKAIYSNSSSFITSNYFVIKYNESEEDALNITKNAFAADNIFNRTKASSSVDFSASMIFDYGASGSIRVIVDGGIVKKENIKVLKQPKAKIVFKKNILTISGLNVGKYILRVTTTPDENHTAVDKDLRITVRKATAVISASKMTVALKSSAIWSIKIINSKTKKPISNMKLTLKVYTGKNYKIVHVITNSRGIASYKTRDLTAGTHKIIVSGTHKGYNFNTVTSQITVIKQTPLKFTLMARSSDKAGAILSYTVSNKNTNKGINGVKLKVLIYTGKKYKTYSLTTKSIKGSSKIYDGAFGFSTNDFSAGKHVVKIMPYALKYKGSTSSYIVIQKSATKRTKFFRVV